MSGKLICPRKPLIHRSSNPLPCSKILQKSGTQRAGPSWVGCRCSREVDHSAEHVGYALVNGERAAGVEGWPRPRRTLRPGSKTVCGHIAMRARERRPVHSRRAPPALAASRLVDADMGLHFCARPPTSEFLAGRLCRFCRTFQTPEFLLALGSSSRFANWKKRSSVPDWKEAMANRVLLFRIIVEKAELISVFWVNVVWIFNCISLDVNDSGSIFVRQFQMVIFKNCVDQN